MANRVLIGLAIMVLLAGCSTRPREFRAQLAAPAPDQSVFERDLQTCQVLARKGVRSNFAQSAAQIGGGTAVGILAGTGAAAIAASTATPSFAATLGLPAVQAASATFTIVAPLAGIGIVRLIRSGREKKYKTALGGCLAEYGYTASGWQKQRKLSRAQVAAVVAAMQVPPQARKQEPPQPMP